MWGAMQVPPGTHSCTAETITWGHCARCVVVVNFPTTQFQLSPSITRAWYLTAPVGRVRLAAAV